MRHEFFLADGKKHFDGPAEVAGFVVHDFFMVEDVS